MKKMLIIVCMFASYCGSLFTVDEQPLYWPSLNSCKYLRAIQQFKDTHEIPKLRIVSIINHSKHDILMVSKSTREQCFIEHEQAVVVPLCMCECQEKIPRNDRLKGICNQFGFCMLEMDCHDYPVVDHHGYCSIELVATLDENMLSVDKIAVQSHITYDADQGCISVHLLAVEDELEDINVTLVIDEFDFSSF